MQNIGKTQKILFVVLGLVAVYAVHDLLTAEKENVEAQSKPPVDAPSIAAVVQNGKSSTHKWPVIDHWKRDPFAGNFESSLRINVEKMIGSLVLPKISNFDLSAISIGGAQAFAVINEEIVGVGDHVNGFKVIEIRSDAVVLKKNDHSFTITLPDDASGF